MKLEEIFDKVPSNKINEILLENGVSVNADFDFSNTNIIIGVNGSGKTRFLKAIKKLYKENGKNAIYGYFPGLSDKKIDYQIDNDNLPVATLYEMLQNSEIEFDDFLKEIERQHGSYLESLLIWHSRLQKERGELAFKTFSDIFQEISGFDVFNKENVMYLKSGDKEFVLSDKIKSFSPGQLNIFYMAIFISIHSSKKIIF